MEAVAPAPAASADPVARWLSLPAAEKQRAFADASPELKTVLLAAEKARLLDDSPGGMATVITAAEGQPEMHGPHHRLIDDAYRRIAAGTLKRCIITMPPQHGKSRRSSMWGPLWYMRRFPDRRVMVTSYSGDLAEGFGRWIRDKLREHAALLGIAVRADSKAAGRFDIVGRRGGLIATGIKGTLTGRSANLLVIDDPLAGRKEAESATERKNVIDLYTGTLLPRVDPKHGAILVIQTRWHEDDLAGWLLKQPDADQWEVISCPALAEDDDPLGRRPGEPLWPEKGYTVEVYGQIRQTVGAYDWASLYQQRPAPAEGGMWTTVDLEHARTGPAAGEKQRRIVAVDPSASGKPGTDECGIVVAEADRDGIATVLDDRSGRMAPADWARTAWQALIDHEADELIFEQNLASGVMELTLRNGWEALQRDDPALGPMPRLRGVPARGDKSFRASPVAQAYRERRVRHARAFPALEDQLLRWVPGNSSPDRMDALVHALTELLGNRASALDAFLGAL